jgi:hypothetical protein
VLPKLKPITVKLIDPETDGTEPDKMTGTGTLNEIALVMHELKCNVVAKASFRPVPALNLETTTESETQTCVSADVDSKEILWEKDADPKCLPKRVMGKLPVVGINEELCASATIALYEADTFWVRDI